MSAVEHDVGRAGGTATAVDVLGSWGRFGDGGHTAPARGAQCDGAALADEVAKMDIMHGKDGAAEGQARTADGRCRLKKVLSQNDYGK